MAELSSLLKRRGTHIPCIMCVGVMLGFATCYSLSGSVPDQLREGDFPNTYLVHSKNGWINKHTYICTQILS